MGGHEWLPFAIDLLPHVQVGDSGPESNIVRAIERWGRDDRPHVVADSAFASDRVVARLQSWGGTFTLACPSTYKSTVWKFLSSGLRDNCHRFLECGGVLYSVTCSADHSGTLHYGKVISTGWNFKLENIEQEETEPIRTESDIPLYQEDDLSKLTIPVLKSLCVQFNVRASGVKKNFVNALLIRSRNLNTIRNTSHSLRQAVTSAGSDGVGPINSLYKECFNGVDVIDRYHGQVKEAHGNNQWKSRFLFNILRTGMINSWVFAQSYEYHSWIRYRELMIDEWFLQ